MVLSPTDYLSSEWQIKAQVIMLIFKVTPWSVSFPMFKRSCMFHESFPDRALSLSNVTLRAEWTRKPVHHIFPSALAKQPHLACYAWSLPRTCWWHKSRPHQSRAQCGSTLLHYMNVDISSLYDGSHPSQNSNRDVRQKKHPFIHSTCLWCFTSHTLFCIVQLIEEV